MRKKVVVIGGGVAGLTAAHELIDRGFDVHVIERRMRLGGKASSVTTDHGFSGEHGFRFFPGWYRHVTDTMARIPYKGRTVADNLVTARQNLFVSYDRDPVPANLRFPRSLQDISNLASAPENILKLGLTTGDFLFFFGKLAGFAALPEEARLARYEKQTWWDFMDADNRSREFRSYLVDGVTRSTVAADPRQASAYTISLVALRTLADTVRPGAPVDRVLNGPTNKVWIDPWVAHLTARGVEFHQDAELESIQFSTADTIASVVVRHGGMSLRTWRTRCHLLRAEQLRRARGYPRKRLDITDDATRDEAKPTFDLLENDEHWSVHHYTYQAHARLAAEGKLPAKLRWKTNEDFRHLSDGELASEILAVRQTIAQLSAAMESSSAPLAADYYVFALPIEQMAYYVNRSQTLQLQDPTLRNLLSLSNHVEWMSGIQFYLTEKLEITPGHIDCLDSEWSLTAICQTQFWTEEDVTEQGSKPWKGEVKTILSVDVSAWTVPGKKFRRPAFNCSAQEIAEEVWQQLKDSINRDNQAPTLVDQLLLASPPGGANGQPLPRLKDGSVPVVPRESYYLDDDVIDRFDRKKQAFYKRFESVRFSTDAIMERQNDRGFDLPTLFAHGDRLKVNAEPLFVNRANTWALRPTPRTRIKNMFLAGDYVKTNTNLATMEASSEAARTAVNEILLISGSNQKPCRIWTLQPQLDAVLSLARFLGMTVGTKGVSPTPSGAVAIATQVSKGLMQSFGEMMMRRK